MTLRENAAVLETYLHNIRNIEEAPPGPAELDALDAAVEAMKAAAENVEYGAFAWDKQRGVFVPIGRSVLTKQLWKKVHCPECGTLCWQRPEDAGVVKASHLDGAVCTKCALRKAGDVV